MFLYLAFGQNGSLVLGIVPCLDKENERGIGSSQREEGIVFERNLEIGA